MEMIECSNGDWAIGLNLENEELIIYIDRYPILGELKLCNYSILNLIDLRDMFSQAIDTLQKDSV